MCVSEFSVTQQSHLTSGRLFNNIVEMLETSLIWIVLTFVYYFYYNIIIIILFLIGEASAKARTVA